MRSLFFLFALWIVLGFGTPIRGQSSNPKADELRKTIAALSARLQNLEQETAAEPDAPDTRITRIGQSAADTDVANDLVLRMYDVSDLFIVAPAYVAMRSDDLTGQARPMFPVVRGRIAAPVVSGGMGGGLGGSGGLFNVLNEQEAPAAQHGEAATRASTPGNLDDVRSTLDELTDAITSTIEPDSWDDVGGDGSLATLGNSLLISNTEQVHRQIAELMVTIRKRWRSLRTVSIEAIWTWQTADQINSVLDQPPEGQPRGIISDKKWEQLHADTEAMGPSRDYRASITCYNGQTVHTLAGQQRLIVGGMTPIVGNGNAAYQPDVVAIQDGAALQVTPVTSSNGGIVTLDVHSRVAVLYHDPHREAGQIIESPRAVAASVDRPNLSIQRISTTTRLPADHPMLIGGMTFTGAHDGDERNLYLFVKASVLELRDDSENQPDVTGPPSFTAP